MTDTPPTNMRDLGRRGGQSSAAKLSMEERRERSRQAGLARQEQRREREAAAEACLLALTAILAAWDEERNMAPAMRAGRVAIEQARRVRG